MHRIGMDQKARELTIHNAFEVTRPRLIKGKKAVLIDDVLTSGATTSQAAKVLKKAGAVRVDVFTLSRAVLR
jgi:predicted amidophosphoribosyltransferase